MNFRAARAPGAEPDTSRPKTNQLTRLFEVAGSTRVGEVVKEFLVKYRENDLSGLAGELSYRVFLSIFPFLIFLAAMSGFIASVAHVSDPGSRLVSIFGDTLPDDAASIISGQADGVAKGSHATVLSLAIVAAIWTASTSAGTTMKAMNRTCSLPETRPLWKRAALAVGMTVSAGLALVIITIGLFATQIHGANLTSWAGVGREFDVVVQIVRIPLILGVVIAATSLIYWLAPDDGRSFRLISPGIVLFGITWTAFTLVFAFYVTNFGSYGATYGALAGVVVLLLWTYASCLLLLAGAQLNAILDERAQAGVPRAIAGLVRPTR